MFDETGVVQNEGCHLILLSNYTPIPKIPMNPPLLCVARTPISRVRIPLTEKDINDQCISNNLYAETKAPPCPFSYPVPSPKIQVSKQND
jgi:hypothetical protein